MKEEEGYSIVGYVGPDDVEDMRAWLLKGSRCREDVAFVKELTAKGVILGIEKIYTGGVKAFIADLDSETSI